MVGTRDRIGITFVLLAALSAHAADRKEIIAGPVLVADGGMSGSFRVEDSKRGPKSVGTGGACLVFSARRRGGAACQADSDCQPDAVFADSSGYCLRKDDARAGRCWIRPAESPSAPYCRRSSVRPLPVGERIAFPVDAGGRLLPVAAPRPGWWRVHACLNLAPGACADPNNPAKQTRDGPPLRTR